RHTIWPRDWSSDVCSSDLPPCRCGRSGTWSFATPYFQRPLELGADLVLHSTTKYLNGHSDMVGGMLVATRDDLAERLAFIQNGRSEERRVGKECKDMCGG